MKKKLLRTVALSECQFTFLNILGNSNGHAKSMGEFTTGEALRKRGLVERYTTYVTKGVYATVDDETVQFKNRKPEPHPRMVDH
jgi:hypothetical protein